MWTDRVYLGSAPAGEDCARVGRRDYEQQARAECLAYMEAIRKVVGAEPAGARLSVTDADPELGGTLEVVCEYDAADPAASNYAARCNEHAPTT